MGHLAWTDLVGETHRPCDPLAPIDHVDLFSADGKAHIGLTGQHEAVVLFARKLEQVVRDAEDPGPDRILHIGRAAKG